MHILQVNKKNYYQTIY